MGIFFVNNVPIVTPPITSTAAQKTSEPDVCPECGKTGAVDIHCLDCDTPFRHGCARNEHEFTFECRCCGYKYEIDDDTTPGWAIALQLTVIVTLLVAAIGLLFIFIAWADQSWNDPKFDKTFLSYLFEKLSQLWQRIITKLF